MKSAADNLVLTNNELVSEEALKQWFGIKQRSALKRCLQEKGIRFFEDKRICTTARAINIALEDKLNFEVDFAQNGT